MDVEFDILYKSLLVHHLERDEIAHELAIRGIEFTEAETRAALARRLREQIKTEKNSDIRDIDFNRLDTTVDEEIKLIDRKIKDIRDYLRNPRRYEGSREALKTRLVHCFARVKRVAENTDEEEDLNDVDSLVSCIRGAFNMHFSFFSAIGQQEIATQLNQSMANMSIGPAGSNIDRKSTASSSQNDDNDFVTPGEHLKRNLKSLDNFSTGWNIPMNNWFPWMTQPGAYPWMFGPPQMQTWPAQKVLHFSAADSASNQVDPVIDKNREIFVKSKNKSSSPKSSRKSKPVSETSSETESGCSTDRTQYSSRRSNRNVRVNNNRREYRPGPRSGKCRPVSDWRLKYDGSDDGQLLMKFLREVEFYAKSENMSTRELFRSAIHLFSGPAKSWYMTGFENDDFSSWEELKEELKREFLSPDHDHTSEIRAIARKQGPREKFQDYFLDIQKIFNSLTKPMTERKKFEIVFRNMRAEYKGHAVSSEIDNLADLKKFGRRLDATYWYKYQPHANENNPRGKQVNEIETGAKRKQKAKPDNEQYKSRVFNNSKSRANISDEEIKRVPNSQQGSERDRPQGLQIVLDNYQVPKDGVCFNCRLKGHHARECDRPRHQYCQRCGFHDVDTDTCPFCKKNAVKTVPEGKPVCRS
ncbi:uncharacterized protein LOC131676186 [Topomyia yanbarensis]|uniref:uncharacterized protein LOC131676186 n=1 Tax=Topomyia yanbarensis TaxID=2498891 RepID=UPI00273C8C5C|nr:uncharacterized protein LOC131676186 [Topomyia yanbarensis]